MEGSHGDSGTADNMHSAIPPAATNSEMHNDSAKVTSAPIDLTTPPLTPPREQSPADGPSKKVPPLEPSSTLPVTMEEIDREKEEEGRRGGGGGGVIASSNPPALVECEDIGDVAEEVEENMEESEGQLLKLEEEEEEEEGEAVALLEGAEQPVLKVEKKEEEEMTELLEGPEQQVSGEEAEEEDVEEKKPLLEGGKVVEEQLLERELERSEEVSSSTKEEEEPSMLVIDIPEPPSSAAQELGVVLDRKGGSPPPDSGQSVGANDMVSSEPPGDKDDDSDKEEELMEITFELASSDQDSSTESDNEGQSAPMPLKTTPPLLCGGSKVGGKDTSPELEQSANVVQENHMDEKGKEGETPKVRSQQDQKVKERPTQVLSDGVLGEEEVGGNSATPSVRQVAKLKRFFTTLQQFGNNLSSEAAEQVQELITALVNGTATIEEFHQEIQTVTNHPLKEFIIPFLRESLDLFRKELKDSSQALSDILGEAPISNSVGLTPTLMDDELPVLPSAKQGSISVPSTPTLPLPSSISQSSATKSTLSTPTQPHPPPTSANPPTQGYSHFSNAAPIMSTGFSDFHDYDSPSSSAAPARKRARRSSNEKLPGSERGPSTSQQSYSNPPKRSRSSYATTPVETAVITSVTSAPSHHPHHPPPAYMHPPPPPPPPPPPRPLSHPSPGETHVGGVTYIPLPQARHGLMAEDWGHIEMMLTSVLGMMETTRQAVAMLKDRVMITQADLERREHDIDSLVQQQVREEAEKMKQQAAEDKQRILLEASKQMREAVAQVRSDMESRMAQAQGVAIREALKEANVQTSSKESCWNCGRQATETCSGCNKARYCGTFCQHKDWGNHMHHCASGLQGHPNVEGSSFSNQQDRDSSSSSSQKSIVMVNDVAVASSNNTSNTQARIVGVSEKMAHASAIQAPNNPNIAFTIKTEKYTT